MVTNFEPDAMGRKDYALFLGARPGLASSRREKTNAVDLWHGIRTTNLQNRSQTWYCPVNPVPYHTCAYNITLPIVYLIFLYQNLLY